MNTALFLAAVVCGTAVPGTEAYLEGCAAQRAGRLTEAVAHFEAGAREEGPLTPYAGARAAACLLQAGRRDEAIAAYGDVLRRFPAGPWVLMIEAELAAIYQGMGMRREAMLYYNDVLNGDFRPWWLERYQWLAVDNLLARDETAALAYPFLRDVLNDTATRSRRFDAAERLARSPLPEDRWTAATAMVRFNAPKAAEKVVTQLQALADTPDRLAQWQYLQGRVLLSKGKAAEGQALLRQVAVEGGATTWARLGRHHLARSLFEGGRRAESKAEIEVLALGAAGHAETGDALWWYAGALAGKGEVDAAVAAYLRLAEVCPDHDRADDGLQEAGQYLRGLKKHKEALAAFDALAARYPLSRLAAEAAYDAGRIREGLHDKAGAMASYDRAVDIGFGNFFGHLALGRLHALGGTKSCDGGGFPVAGTGLRMGLIRTGDPAAEPAVASRAEETSLALLRFFGAHGLPEAEWEALHLVRVRPKGAAVEPLIRAMADAGVAHTANQFMHALAWGVEDGTPLPGRLRVMYPRPYWTEVKAMADAAGVDPYLVLAVARQESTFRPAVVSSAGATGVMQLMPGTAKWLADVDSAILPEHAGHLENPACSLRLGAHYLARMLRSNDGNLIYALASYNGGPGNVRKWRRERPGLEPEVFIESIPFAETRDYVKRVLGNYAAYRSLYGD